MAGARISFDYSRPESAGTDEIEADASGHFRLLLHSRVPTDLEAVDPQGRWSAVSAADVEPGTLDLVLQFRTEHLVEVLVRDEHDRLVETFAVHTRRVEGGGPENELPMDSRPSGSASLRAPEHDFSIEVDAPGWGPADLTTLPYQNIPRDIYPVYVTE